MDDSQWAQFHRFQGRLQAVIVAIGVTALLTLAGFWMQRTMDVAVLKTEIHEVVKEVRAVGKMVRRIDARMVREAQERKARNAR